MNIPPDVVNEILVRLPVKCLLKFRCVCKAWCALIRSSHFIDFHLNHPCQNNNNRTDYLLLLLKRCETIELLYYSRREDINDGLRLRVAAPNFPAFDHPMGQICGPCNGIVCVVANSFHHYDPHEEVIYLCNPATREIRRLPDRPFGAPVDGYSPHRRSKEFFLCQRRGLGFGFDSCNNDYKVVSIVFFPTNDTYYGYGLGFNNIEIYELSTNSWRVADTILPENYCYNSCSWDFGLYGYGLFFNGCLHWVGALKVGINSVMSIFAFDVSNEVMRVIQYPPHEYGTLDPYEYGTLVVLEDFLALIFVVIPSGGPLVLDEQIMGVTIVIWVMMEYGVEESWIKRFSLGPFSGIPIPLTCWNDHTLLVQSKDGKVVSCDLLKDDHPIKKHNVNACSGIIIHKESLISLA